MIYSSTPNHALRPSRRPALRSNQEVDVSPIMRDSDAPPQTSQRSSNQLRTSSSKRHINGTSKNADGSLKSDSEVRRSSLKKPESANNFEIDYEENVDDSEEETSDESYHQGYEDIDSIEQQEQNDSEGSAREPVIPEIKDDKRTNWLSCAVIIGVVISAILLFVPVNNKSYNNEGLTIKELERKFVNQSPNLWLALETSIMEIQTLKKPWTIMLLYNSNSEKTLKQLLPEIMKYSICNLKDCSEKSIFLERGSLNLDRYINDYGALVHEIKPVLQTRAVLIVEDLDTVPGRVARAFHTICDEYTPLVEKVLVIFTLKINSDEDSLSEIEDKLRSHRDWEQMEYDIFAPLFTRITNTVIRIHPETLEEL